MSDISSLLVLLRELRKKPGSLCCKSWPEFYIKTQLSDEPCVVQFPLLIWACELDLWLALDGLLT